jgi:hypothetical protein
VNQIADALMSKAIKILKFIFIFSLVVLFTECAPAKKNSVYEKRKKASRINTSQLGRNRYYFSTGYQKKLSKGYKKK